MSITARCGACQKVYKVDDQWAGKKVRCKNCGQIFAIPKVVVGVPLDEGAPAQRPEPARPKPAAARPQATRPSAQPAEAGAGDDPFGSLDALMALEQTGTVNPEPAQTAPAYKPPKRAAAELPLSPPPYAPPAQPLSYAGPQAPRRRVSSPNSAAIETLVHLVFPLVVIGLSWGLQTALGFVGIFLSEKPGLAFIGFVLQQGMLFGVVLPIVSYGVQLGADNAKFDVPERPRMKVFAIMCSWGLVLVIMLLAMAFGGAALFRGSMMTPASILKIGLSVCGTSLAISLGVGYLLFKLWFGCTWVQALVGYLFLILFSILAFIVVFIIAFAIGFMLGGVMRVMNAAG